MRYMASVIQFGENEFVSIITDFLTRESFENDFEHHTLDAAMTCALNTIKLWEENETAENSITFYNEPAKR